MIKSLKKYQLKKSHGKSMVIKIMIIKSNRKKKLKDDEIVNKKKTNFKSYSNKIIAIRKWRPDLTNKRFDEWRWNWKAKL